MRRWLIAGGVALVVLVAAVLVLLTRDDGDDNGELSNPIPAGGRLDAGGRQLASLLERGRDGTWHAKYMTPPEGESAAQTLEVWRRGDRTRQDTISTSGSETAHTVGLRLGERVESCTKSGDAAWVCREVTAASLDPDQTFAEAIGELGNRSVTPRSDTVAGVPGTCFAIAAGGTSAEPGEVCVSDDGVPLRIKGEGASIEIVSLDASVPASAFESPR